MSCFMNLKKTLAVLVLSAFAGCGQNDAESARLRASASQKFSLQYISVLTKENLVYNLPLECSKDQVDIFINSDRKRRLHFYEAEKETDLKISPEEYFVMTDPANQFTHIAEYSGVDDANNELWFWDMSSYIVVRLPYDPATNTAQLNVANINRKIVFDPLTKKIAVDQNGDGVFNGEQSPIVYYDGEVLLEEDLLK